MTIPPFFSLVFVNYQSADHLRGAIRSLFAQETDRSLYEIVISNNDPREKDSLAQLRVEFPTLQVVESSVNKGFGGGANLGAARAQSPILGFLNPDLVWQEPILSDLRESFLSQPRLGIAGPKLLTEKGVAEPWSHGPEPTLWEVLKNNLPLHPRQEPLRDAQKASEEKDWVSGAALFIRANLFGKLGGFDERFFLYFEDVDLCWRARELGFQVKLFSQLSIIHKGGKSQASPEEQKKHFYRSQALYFQKHFSRASYFFLRLLRWLRHGH